MIMNQADVKEFQRTAQLEAKRVIEKLDPENITSFIDFFQKINECIKHAERSEGNYKELVAIRAQYISKILDKTLPIPNDATDSVKELFKHQREQLFIKSGWKNMSTLELARLARNE